MSLLQGSTPALMMMILIATTLLALLTLLATTGQRPPTIILMPMEPQDRGAGGLGCLLPLLLLAGVLAVIMFGGSS